MKQTQQQQPTKYRSNEFADLLIAALQTEEETSFTWPTTQLNITFKKMFDIVKEHDTSKGTITSNIREYTSMLLSNDGKNQENKIQENEISSTSSPRQSRMADTLPDSEHSATGTGAIR
jgi:hypothetical protein